MRIGRLISPLLLAGPPLTACASQSGPADQSGLSVSATGSVYLVPDVVEIDLGVQTQSSVVGSAVANNNRLAGAVMAAVTGQGVAIGDIQETYFSVRPQQKFADRGSPAR